MHGTIGFKMFWQLAGRSGIITIRKVSGAAEFDLKRNVSLQKP
jgi:hypothetical protein